MQAEHTLHHVSSMADQDASNRHRIDSEERDACALICSVRKGGSPTHGNVKRTIEALARMGHRTGYINSEGDGVGILTDIPRQLWSKRLAANGLMSSMATDRNFWVAHVMISAKDRSRAHHIVNRMEHVLAEAGLHILIDQAGQVDSTVLGPNAEKNEPLFWQIAGVNGQVPHDEIDRALFDLQVKLETELDVHFASFSRHSVVYKVQGSVEVLRRYYPELRDPDYASMVTMGHARYSTNTNPVFERAQPFCVLGHNGEFNTISRFRIEAAMLGIPLPVSGSDSQDVDRVVYALCARHNLDLIEAMEHIFPPYPHDLIQERPDISQMYDEIRQALGHFAQGPAAVAARLGDQLVFSVDSLGLRPLWFGETEKEYFASSERGVYSPDNLVSDPKPLAPGEKIALRVRNAGTVEVLDYPQIQLHTLQRYQTREITVPGDPVRGTTSPNGKSKMLFSDESVAFDSTQRAQAAVPELVALAEPSGSSEVQTGRFQTAQLNTQRNPAPGSYSSERPKVKLNAAVMSGLGWERYHLGLVETMAEAGKEQIGSLGWDGALAAFSQKRVNIADYFKETVAVVTNPSIDREREQSQFSTQSVIGTRPAIGSRRGPDDHIMVLKTPILLGDHAETISEALLAEIAHDHGTLTISELITAFSERASTINMSARMDESIEAAIERIQQEAVATVRNGVQCLVLDDNDVLEGHNLWLDPMLVTAAVDRALRSAEASPNLRRQVGIVLRSGALRDLHDLVLCISMGANAVLPYALYAVGLGIAPKGSNLELDDEQIRCVLHNLLTALQTGMEKVISTIGCHELRGYGHSYSSIGLSRGIAAIFGTPNYFGSEARGLTWGALQDDANERTAEMRGDIRARLNNPDRFYPKMWKKVEALAQGEIGLEEYSSHLLDLENNLPIEVRHLLDIKTKDEDEQISPEDVDISINGHAMPALISAMSFGSQGELSYRAYAEAAHQLNIICINGEGGELPDLLGKYRRNRGQQVASARFGVNIALLNAADYLEIKIGQGAKPGEGGHLPGFKVTEQIAAVRHTTPGVGLISPSNNHDLYSIEDLAQLIDELKTAAPHAKVSVKIPVVPGVGIIAVGVAKAGADIITLTGYTGGTGAARAHALRHVGLPAEIGLWLAHRALLESELRNQVELWVDGGMKSGRDVVKMLCLGANRVGFGTLAMVAVGCTICRDCHSGTCHVGITTHVKTRDEAESRGFKAFRPFEEKGSAAGIVRVFDVIAEETRRWIAKMGFRRAQDLVGRADLLEQVACHDRIDLSMLLKPAPQPAKRPAQPGGRRLSRPRNTVSRQITEVIAEYVARGEYELTYEDQQVMAMDRALGTHLCGAIARGDIPHTQNLQAITLSFSNSALPGNGLGAFLDDPVRIVVEGGAQDGVGKGARGGTITVLKGLNHNGVRLDGSVGKSFAYGAQGGTFIVQGNADTRACIRMSGADVIFGGEITQPLRDHLGGIGARANLKGYAFEYMTSGRALVLGDPGPWICAGMTGGTIYQRLNPRMGLDEAAIQRRIAPGATVVITPLHDNGVDAVRELLGMYIETLEFNNQAEAARSLHELREHPQQHFIKIAPPVRVN